MTGHRPESSDDMGGLWKFRASGNTLHTVVSKLTALQVDLVSYMDDLAEEIGVRPSRLWLFFTDYPLFKRVLSLHIRSHVPGSQDENEVEDESNASSTGRWLKLMVAMTAGGAALYFLHDRSPDTISSLMSKIRLITT
uniref:Uncharacterized protein n=1 Tax=Knipowitschia caucasica TaxID=637954 RepID=A0AAV2KV28_KNICA